MIIDFHTHAYPDEDNDQAPWNGSSPFTIANILDSQRANGIDKTVVSNPLHEMRGMDRDDQLKAVSRINRFLASTQARHDSIECLATTVPCGDDKFLRELERAVRQDGLRGVLIMSSLQGQYPDDDEALPFFQLAVEMDIPVVIHPPAVGFGEERMKDYRLASSVGRPMDNCLAIARLIVRGILERFPTLKLVGTHLGGGICEVIGRMDYAYEEQESLKFLGPYAPMMISKPPTEYLKQVYLESTCYHLPAARCALETVGADHFIFGTDSPPLVPLKARGVKLIRDLALPAEDERKVFGSNAAKVMNL